MILAIIINLPFIKNRERICIRNLGFDRKKSIKGSNYAKMSKMPQTRTFKFMHNLNLKNHYHNYRTKLNIHLLLNYQLYTVIAFILCILSQKISEQIVYAETIETQSNTDSERELSPEQRESRAQAMRAIMGVLPKLSPEQQESRAQAMKAIMGVLPPHSQEPDWADTMPEKVKSVLLEEEIEEPKIEISAENVNEIFNDFYVTIKTAKNSNELAIEAIAFVDNVLPEEIFAKNAMDITDPQSITNQFLDYFSHNVILDDFTKRIGLAYFRSALHVSNELFVNKLTEASEKMIIDMFHEQVEKELTKVQNYPLKK